MKIVLFLTGLILLLGKQGSAYSEVQLALKTPRSCSKPQVRQEFRELPKEQWTAFIDALKSLMKREPQKPSLYDEWASFDATHSDEAKGYAPFLAYNRLQLKAFEQALQVTHPNVTLPYWNWTLDAEHPETSPLLTAEYLGGNGEAPRGCIATGPFKDYQVPSAKGFDCLKRSYYPGPSIAPFATREHIEKTVLRTRRYDQLRQFLIYAPTNAVFHGIGGQLMSQEPAQDPIYWLHMAYLDKLWADWQKKDKSHQKSVGGMLRDSSIANLQSSIPGSQHKIADVMATRDLCYEYGAGSGKGKAAR